MFDRELKTDTNGSPFFTANSRSIFNDYDVTPVWGLVNGSSDRLSFSRLIYLQEGICISGS